MDKQNTELVLLEDATEPKTGGTKRRRPEIRGQPRVKTADRQQMVLRAVDVEELVAEDHPVRAVWEFVGRLDLSRFYEPIEATEGVAGRAAWDPRLLISLWLWAYSLQVQILLRVGLLLKLQTTQGKLLITMHSVTMFGF